MDLLLDTHIAPHHRDPFDRLLVAQARSESRLLMTADPLIARYDAPIVFVG